MKVAFRIAAFIAVFFLAFQVITFAVKSVIGQPTSLFGASNNTIVLKHDTTTIAIHDTPLIKYEGKNFNLGDMTGGQVGDNTFYTGMQRRKFTNQQLNNISQQIPNKKSNVEIMIPQNDKEASNFGEEIVRIMKVNGYINTRSYSWNAKPFNWFDTLHTDVRNDSTTLIFVSPQSNVK
jgi:hypothetical protein